jgi:hypothetical protein
MYEGTAHHGVGRVANSMRGVHAVFHAPQGDDYVNPIFTMLERTPAFPQMTTSVVSGRDLAQGTIRLPETLRQRPQVLDHLSGADLGQSILLHAERLTGGSFGSVLQAVGRIDLAKANALVEVLRDGDGLPDLLQKCLDEGVGLLGELSGLDLGRAAPLIDALRDGFAFLKLLREVAHSAAELVERLDGFDPFAPLGSPAGDSP